jgi:hypothetical protein
MLDGSTAWGAIAVAAPQSNLLVPGRLSSSTIADLHDYFAEKHHRPSDDMWAALEDLAVTLEAVANDVAPAKFFLSSLDPGVGKTQTVSHFLNALLASPAHADVGVLICLARLSEIKNLVRDSAIPEDMFAVFTSDEKVNALGKSTVDQARVLFTTQQMLESRLIKQGEESSAFVFASDFYFHGAPRRVRVWDESWLPGQTVTIKRDELGLLFQPLRVPYPALANQLEELFISLKGQPDGTCVQLPDFAEKYATNLDDILRLFDKPVNNDDAAFKDSQRRAVSAFWYLSGKTVSIRQDGPYGNTVINYKDTLPDDLAPMVILDASGRVRHTYREIEEGRGMLVRLKTAAKDYSRLTVNVWRTPGGKSAFKKGAARLIEGIARTVDTRPDEDWLIVHHRQDNYRVGDIQVEVEKLLKPRTGKVSFITWGNHMATNDYKEVPNVILAGTLFYRLSHYEAVKRLAGGLRPESGSLTKADLDLTIAGEHAHGILQALCRGSVRKCDGSQCPPCRAYIIASVESGIYDLLPDVFPGCTVVSWKPVKTTLQGHVKAAVEVIERWLEMAKEGETLPFKLVSKAIGVTPHDFKNNIRCHDDFKETVADMGLKEWSKGKLYTAFARACTGSAEP